MKRYFYTDPLAAAYMAKHFGMKLEARHTDEQMAEYDILESDRWFDWWDSCIVDGWEHEIETVSDAVAYIKDASSKIYVHPDSLHLLEPKVGDLILEPEKDTGARIELSSAYHWNKSFDWEQRQPAKIIQRNGLPFMWPEQE